MFTLVLTTLNRIAGGALNDDLNLSISVMMILIKS